MEAKEGKQKAVVIALIRNDEGKILLQKRIDTVHVEADGKWEFPGGVIEFGELPKDALIRECREEIGCAIEVVRLLPYLHTRVWERTDGQATQAFVSCFEARIGSGVPRSLDGASSEVRWYVKDEAMALDTLPGIKEFIDLLDEK